MTPKDLALVGWALARTRLPNDSSIFKSLKTAIYLQLSKKRDS